MRARTTRLTGLWRHADFLKLWAGQTVSVFGDQIGLLALPLLGLARLLPADGVGLWLRLVAASLVLLLPGSLVARGLRLRGASATVAFGLGALGPALLLVFLVELWMKTVKRVDHCREHRHRRGIYGKALEMMAEVFVERGVRGEQVAEDSG